MNTREKIARAEEIIRRHAPLIIAYSGGADSTCLLALAVRAAGKDNILAAIADSPSLPRAALAEALHTAARIGAKVEVVVTAEFENEDYLSNPANRCYFCKAGLFSALHKMACERGFRAIACGENADDPADMRPGSRAAAEFHVLAPLKAAGLSKEEVRAISKQLGLPTHNAPAQPCLSSRIPHGTRVTVPALAMIENGETFVRSLGFRVFRVRYIEGPPPRARVQIAREEMKTIPAHEAALREGLAAAGFASVEIDPEGYPAHVPTARDDRST
ncbi:MAG: ATP-dependent sacrificial sulfur transferase LarE [Verrucomicrobiae bacterium]